MSGLEVIDINYLRGKGGSMFRKGREIVDIVQSRWSSSSKV
jgi:hypothetical protein